MCSRNSSQAPAPEVAATRRYGRTDTPRPGPLSFISPFGSCRQPQPSGQISAVLPAVWRSLADTAENWPVLCSFRPHPGSFPTARSELRLRGARFATRDSRAAEAKGRVLPAVVQVGRGGFSAVWSRRSSAGRPGVPFWRLSSIEDGLPGSKVSLSDDFRDSAPQRSLEVTPVRVAGRIATLKDLTP